MASVTRKKSTNVYKSCPKMIFTPLQKLPKNVGDFGKLIAAQGFKKLPKVQTIAKSGHTAHGKGQIKVWLFASWKGLLTAAAAIKSEPTTDHCLCIKIPITKGVE